MSAWKSVNASLVLLAGLATPALAQKAAPVSATGVYPANQLTGGLTEFYAMTPNFANYGFSGTYPNLGGYGYPASGPGPQFGAHYASTPTPQPRPTAAKPSPKAVPKPKAARSANGPTRGPLLPGKGL